MSSADTLGKNMTEIPDPMLLLIQGIQDKLNDILNRQISNVEGVAELKSGQQAVISRLDKINGRILDHEKRIEKVESIHVADEKKKESSNQFMRFVAPFIYAFIGGLTLGVIAQCRPITWSCNQVE